MRILIAFISMFLTTSAMAHSWYDYDCCHDKDCAPILSEEMLPDGSYRIGTKVGTAIWRPGSPSTRIRPSQDEQEHACILQGTNQTVVICLYRRAGT